MPGKTLTRRIRSAREDAVNEAEANMLLDACLTPLDYLVVCLPLYTGMRIGEVQHLKATWLDRGFIQIPARQICGCGECKRFRGGVWKPKTRAGIRSLLLQPPQLESALRDIGTGINRCRRNLEWRFQKIRERSGIARWVYPHCLRASFATKMAERGMSAPALAYTMGWTGLMSAESYIQSTARRAHEEWQHILTLY